MSTTISLKTGDNYISFPAISTSTIGELLFTGPDSIDANVQKDNNGKRIFYKYNPIPVVSQEPWEYVNDSDFIEKGTGYYIKMILDDEINYSGFVYNLTFDQIRSKLVAQEFNLIGPGNNILSIPKWCKILDPIAQFPVNQILPTRAYWIYYNECQLPSPDPLILIFGLGLIVSVISLFLSLRGKKEEAEGIV